MCSLKLFCAGSRPGCKIFCDRRRAFRSLSVKPEQAGQCSGMSVRVRKPKSSKGGWVKEMMEDSQIIELYWKRSEQAVSETAQKYGNYCNTIAYRILNDREDAEECVNDTWLRAWNSMPPNRPGVLSAFLARITRNLSLNRCEKQNAAKRGGGEM